MTREQARREIPRIIAGLKRASTTVGSGEPARVLQNAFNRRSRQSVEGPEALLGAIHEVGKPTRRFIELDPVRTDIPTDVENEIWTIVDHVTNELGVTYNPYIEGYSNASLRSGMAGYVVITEHADRFSDPHLQHTSLIYPDPTSPGTGLSVATVTQQRVPSAVKESWPITGVSDSLPLYTPPGDEDDPYTRLAVVRIKMPPATFGRIRSRTQ